MIKNETEKPKTKQKRAKNMCVLSFMCAGKDKSKNHGKTSKNGQDRHENRKGREKPDKAEKVKTKKRSKVNKTRNQSRLKNNKSRNQAQFIGPS